VDEARLALRTVAPGARRPYVDLLREAEDSTSEIESYLDTGELFLYTDGDVVVGPCSSRRSGPTSMS
jgi:hypothetical protein